MIESVVGLLMFVNGEIKEARLQALYGQCLRGKRHADDNFLKELCTNAGRVKQN